MHGPSAWLSFTPKRRQLYKPLQSGFGCLTCPQKPGRALPRRKPESRTCILAKRAKEGRLQCQQRCQSKGQPHRASVQRETRVCVWVLLYEGFAGLCGSQVTE